MSSDRRDVVEDLNRLMAEEVEACLRYFQIRFRLRGKDRHAAGKFFEEALRETLEHADAIGKQIEALGQTPTLHVHLTLGGGLMPPEDALTEALEVEQQALDAYKDFLPRTAGDAALEQFIHAQIEVGTEHVQEIRDLLRSGVWLKLVAKPAVDDSSDR